MTLTVLNVLTSQIASYVETVLTLIFTENYHYVGGTLLVAQLV